MSWAFSTLTHVVVIVECLRVKVVLLVKSVLRRLHLVEVPSRGGAIDRLIF